MSVGKSLKWFLGGPTTFRYRAARSGAHALRSASRQPELLYRRISGRPATVSVGRYTMMVPEDMRWAFAEGTYYEHTLSTWLQRLAISSPSPVFYDIGANYGYYTLLLSPIMREVHAFEPVTTTHAVLSQNCVRNGLDMVTIHKIGLGDQQTEAGIRLFTSSGNNSLFDVTVGNFVRPVGIESIKLTTLDGMVYEQGLTPPGLIKMDVEGAELFVVRGGRRTLQEFHPTLTAEFYEPHFQKAGYAREDLMVELEDLGYSLFAIPEQEEELRAISGGTDNISTIVAIEPSRVNEVLGRRATP